VDRQHSPLKSLCTSTIKTPQSGVPLDVKLTGFDLNLLVALEALLVCQNVTHAARRIGQTQPAVSRALARLRELLGDDILVRSSTGMKLTARGEYLARTVPATISHVRDVISARRANADVRLSINANLVPALLPHFLRSAPSESEPLKVSIHKTFDGGVAQLRSYSVEYVLGSSAADKRDGISSEVILEEQFVTLAAFQHHSLGGARPTEKAFLELTHINLVEKGREIFPQFVETLIGYGVRRSRLFDVPDVTSAALLASESSLALTVPRSMANWLAKTVRLSVFLPPIPVPKHEVALCWLADSSGPGQRRVIDRIGDATKKAIAQDQTPMHVVRPSETDVRI
jgi:DNA-binding transcriptional LysR family regulator